VNKDWWKLSKKPSAATAIDPPATPNKEQEVYIKTGSYSLDGTTIRSGFPLEKTNIARKPSKAKGEVHCYACDGEGWDANSGGGVFICPKCSGTGIVDGNILCTCGHKKFEHYLGVDTCEHDYLDLYGEGPDGNNVMIHGGEYRYDGRPCKCNHFQEVE